MIWPVIDLFSGCGGMSYGFHTRKPFRLVAAVDAQVAKPCEKMGRLNCNSTYSLNMGITPMDRDVFDLTPMALMHVASVKLAKELRPGDLTVLLACPPCTDFSRAKPTSD